MQCEPDLQSLSPRQPPQRPPMQCANGQNRSLSLLQIKPAAGASPETTGGRAGDGLGAAGVGA